MDSFHEASYYEIALTNRQVLGVFIVLLVCIVASFFAGVWVGRERTGEPVPEVVAAATEEAPTENPLKRLGFFDEDREPEPAPADKAKQPAPQATSRPPATAPDAEALARRQAAIAAARRRRQEALAAGETPPHLQRPRRRAAGQALAEAPEATAGAESAGSAPLREAAGADLVIQVFSSADRLQAKKVLDRLVTAGYEAFLSPVEVDGRSMYRVRIGPFAERSAAESAAEKVRSLYHLDTWITARNL